MRAAFRETIYAVTAFGIAIVVVVTWERRRLNRHRNHPSNRNEGRYE